MKPKRKRGRPPKLPDEYHTDLVNLLQYWQSNGRLSLSAICDHIVKKGGVKWIDSKTGRTVAEITDKRTLRTRLIEAKKRHELLKWWLSKHLRAAELELPIKFGITVERRRKLTLTVLGLPPKYTTRLRIGKKNLHSRA